MKDFQSPKNLLSVQSVFLSKLIVFGFLCLSELLLLTLFRKFSFQMKDLQKQSM